MARVHNTDRNGIPFSEAIRRAVWNKATMVAGKDPTLIRKDRCGAWIDWRLYGNTTVNGSGWEIDHITPVSRGGGDDISNLQPLQWQNNRCKSDNDPATNYAVVTASN